MSFNINAQSLANMTPEELQAYILSQVATLSTPAEIDEFKTAVDDALSEYRTEVQDQIDEMKKTIRGNGHRADRLEGADLEEANRILDELKNELKDIDKAVGNADDDITKDAAHQALVDQDLSAADDPTITGANYETADPASGELPVYTIHVGSGNSLSSNPLSDATESGTTADFDQFLKDHVPPILDSDGKLIPPNNYTNIQAARREWLASKRVVTITLPAGSTIELSNPDDNGAVVFKITDKDGKVAYLRIEGDAYLNFTNGITREYANTAIRGDTPIWPDDLINRSLYGGTLFSETLHPVTPEQEQAQELGYVPGYEQGATAATTASPYLGVGVTLSDTEKAKFQTYWDKLYQAIAENKPIGPVWDEILATASPKLIEALIFAIAKTTPQNFSALFNGQATILENILTGGASDENLTSAMKLAILLLETYAGPGNYGGGATLFDTLFAHKAADGTTYEAGRWTGETGDNEMQNEIVLRQFSDLSARLTGTHGDINAAIDNETAFKTQVDAAATAAATAATQAQPDATIPGTISQAEYDAMRTMMYADMGRLEDDGDVEEGTLASTIDSILTYLLHTKMTTEETRTYLLRVCDIGGSGGDDLTTNIINFLGAYAPEVMTRLLDPLWNLKMWRLIENGGDTPEMWWDSGSDSGHSGYYRAKGILGQ